MGLEKILNLSIVADSVLGFSAGFIQGMRYSKFNKYSDYYDSKELKEKNNTRLANSVFYGSILPVFDFIVKRVPQEQVRYEFVAGLASSVIGFGSGKIIGSLFYKNNDKPDKVEQEQLTKYLNNMREATKKRDILELFKNIIECQKFIIHLGNKKPNKKLRDNISSQLADNMDYCELYNRIREDIDSPNSSTIVFGIPQYPKAHALILGESRIIDLSIHFDHYSMIERDDFLTAQLNVQPNLSKREIEWDSDIDRVIDMANSYKKDNTVLVVIGGKDEHPMKKERDASIRFTIAYTGYIKAKQIAKDMREKDNRRF